MAAKESFQMTIYYLHVTKLKNKSKNSNIDHPFSLSMKKFKPLASHGILWQHSKIPHCCDTQNYLILMYENIAPL